ncbi:MAG TPA: hypothetical protein VF575_02945 [Candidatus Saccharimonadales bacterium]|jgi:hypothetical protein
MRHRLHGSIFGLAIVGLLTIALHAAPAAAASQLLAPIGSSFAATASQQSGNRPAVGTSKRGGVTVSPAFQQISLTSDNTTRTFDFAVTNNSAQEYEFALSVVDFGSLDETGGVLFVGNAEKALSYRYALSPWVTLEKDRIVVAPYATEKIPITLNNKESLTPGGHYGAVLVTPTEVGGNSQQKVQIDQVASSLLFVKKLGGEVYNLNLSNSNIATRLLSLPGTLDLRFQNRGNVHVTPRGIATVTDPRGRIVQRATINPDSAIVMPETFRSISMPFDRLAAAWLPGRYKMTIAYRYDDQATFRTVESSFVYVNLGFALGVLAIVAAGLSIVLSKRVRTWTKQSLKKLGSRLRRLPGRVGKNPR